MTDKTAKPEPTMEEILASIRKIISEDDPHSKRPEGAKAKPSAVIEVLELTTVAQEEDTPKVSTKKPAVTETPTKSDERTQGKLVFVSYSTKDVARANDLVKALEASGVKCWIAPRDIPPGSNYNAEIVKALDNCTDFILLFTEHSNDSVHVKRELNLWLERNRPLVPVKMDHTVPSHEFRYLLAGMQWATETDNRALLPLLTGKPT